MGLFDKLGQRIISPSRWLPGELMLKLSDAGFQGGFVGHYAITLPSQDCTVDRLVRDAMADTSELLGNLTDLPPPMYTHPELGCGCEFRFDDHRCGWPIS